MKISNIEGPIRGGDGDYTRQLGMFSVAVVNRLLGRAAVGTSPRIVLEHMDLGLLDFMATGLKIPKLRQTTTVNRPVGGGLISGGGMANGIRGVELVFLRMEDAPRRVASLASLALRAASGDTGASLGVLYDGNLEVPEGVIHANIDNMYMVSSGPDSVIFGDPYEPHPDGSPNRVTPPRQLFDSRLRVYSLGENLADAHQRAITTLSSATQQLPEELTAMVAAGYGLTTDEFGQVMGVFGPEVPPIEAGRAILSMIDAPVAQS